MATAPLVRYPLAEFILARSRRSGPVTRAWLGRRYVYLVGPQANEFVFAHDAHFSAHEAMKGLIPVDGPTSVVVSDPPEHPRRRALVRPGLHHRQVNGYLTTMARAADEALDQVTPGEPFDAYELFRAAIRRSTMRALFGEQVGARADAMGAALQPLLDLTDLLPDTIDLHCRLNTPRWRRAQVARSNVDAFVHDQIDQIAAHPDGGTHTQVLATLVHGRDGAGSGLSRQEIRDQIVTLIAAGYETTSAAMGWTLYGLGGNRAALDAARAEVADVTGGAAPTVEHLPRLRHVRAAVDEALRLYPPASIVPRHVTRELTYEGRRISRGTTLIYSPYATHRSAPVYEDPLEYRPQRWLDGLEPSRGEFVPFGGGAHRCLGSTMAVTELTVMLARLLDRADFTLEPRRVRATGISSMRPGGGVWLRLGAV